MNSLKRQFWIALITLCCTLGAIVVLGLLQYRLTAKLNRTLLEGEKILFHYRAIHESITENLLLDSMESLEGSVADLERLNARLTRLKSSGDIPGEFKMALADKIDLAGLAIQLKQMAQGGGEVEKKGALLKELRAIGNYLLYFDRIVAGQARQGLVNFQAVVIGALGLLLSLASVALILFYRNTVAPLIRIAADTGKGELSLKEIVQDKGCPVELVLIAEAMEACAQVDNSDYDKEQEIRELVGKRLGLAVNETANRLNGIMNYAQLLYDDLGEDDQERRLMLARMIDEGAGLAKEWQGLTLEGK